MDVFQIAIILLVGALLERVVRHMAEKIKQNMEAKVCVMELGDGAKTLRVSGGGKMSPGQVETISQFLEDYKKKPNHEQQIINIED